MRPAWSDLEIEAQRRLLRHFGGSPLAECSAPGSPVEWVRTGVFSNTHNGVLTTRLSTGDADAAIAAVVDGFGVRRLPAIWYVSAGDRPTDLPERLTRAGCRSERTGVVMGAPTGGIAEAAPPPGIAIRELIAPGQVEDWGRVASAVWSESPIVGDPDDGDGRQHARLYASLPLGPASPWRHWLAFDQRQQPVGMVSGVFTAQAVLIEHLGVVPARRGRGLGAALATVPVRVARTAGLRWAVLGPTPDSAPLYRRLGFTTQPCRPDRQFYLPMTVTTG
jgi:GNAT superfamily N-acetyltransferase